jgi:hypothetical protein
VEKDNGIPSLDRRASGHEKRSQCKQHNPPHGFIAEREKFSAKFTRFITEKMKENEP